MTNLLDWDVDVHAGMLIDSDLRLSIQTLSQALVSAASAVRGVPAESDVNATKGNWLMALDLLEALLLEYERRFNRVADEDMIFSDLQHEANIYFEDDTLDTSGFFSTVADYHQRKSIYSRTLENQVVTYSNPAFAHRMVFSELNVL